jgi:hypothetical protein
LITTMALESMTEPILQLDESLAKSLAFAIIRLVMVAPQEREGVLKRIQSICEAAGKGGSAEEK